MNVRRRTIDDCASIARIVTVCWNETYRGIVDKDFLDNLYKNEQERIISSKKKFNENDNHQFVLEMDAKVVGWINVGSSDYGNDYGEIHAIYIMKEYQGKGYGRLLINEGIKELKSMGFNKMVIGCLEGNKSNEFYKHIGGKFVKQRIFEKLGLPENVYMFDKI